MADVITRFKLETTQFDSKLRDAAKGLRELTHMAEIGGKGFKDFSQKQIEAARAFGTIESGATNTKDKLKDLVGAYNDVARAYNNLTEQQRQSDFGKAMAQSLEQLQERIKETKQELYSLGESKGGGLFGEGGFLGMFQVAGGNLISKGIENLIVGLTDAWTKSIELAKEGEGVRIAFERLNRPGLLDNLKEATHGTVSEIELMKQAIKFENFKLPLEDLATYLEFAQQKAKDTGESIDYLVNSIVNGLGRQSKQILDNLGISAAELTRRMNEGADMTKAVAEIIREEMAKAGDYVETAADRAAQAAAKATDEMEKFGQTAAPIAEQWGQVWNSITIGAMDFANTLLGPVAESIRSIQNILGTTLDDRRIQMFAAMEGISRQQQAAANKKKPTWGDVPVYTAPGGYVEVTDSNTGAVIGGQHFDNLDDSNAIKAWRKALHKSGGSSKKTNTPSIDDFNKALAKSLTGSADLKQVKEALSPYEMMLPEIKKNILDIKDADLGGSLAKIGDDKVKKEIEEMTKALQQQQMAFQMGAQAAASFGAALAGIEDPATKAAGTVIQAIAQIALGFGTAVAQASSMGPYAWIAYTAAAMGAMATAISTVHSLTGYAEGGIVKGNSYSGDNLYGPGFGINAGELVLNTAQQNNVAQALEGGGMKNLKLEGVLKGENIWIAANRYTKRTGQGEIVTW